MIVIVFGVIGSYFLGGSCQTFYLSEILWGKFMNFIES